MPESPKSLVLRAVLVGVRPIVARVTKHPRQILTLENLREEMLGAFFRVAQPVFSAARPC